MSSGNPCDNLGNLTGISVNGSNLCEKAKGKLEWPERDLGEILGGLNRAVETLKEAGWSDNDVATLITEGFVPAANALKTKWNNADDVATLIRDGFAPAAIVLGQDKAATALADVCPSENNTGGENNSGSSEGNGENSPKFCDCVQPLLKKVLETLGKDKTAAESIKNAICSTSSTEIQGALLYAAIILLGKGWDQNNVATLIKDGFVRAAEKLEGARWRANQVAKLITEGFVPAANALKEAGWNADEVATLITKSFVPAAQTRKAKWNNADEVATLITKSFVPTAQTLREKGWTVGEIATLITKSFVPTAQTLREKGWTVGEIATLIKDGLAPAANALSSLGADQVATLIKDGFAPVAIVLKPKHAADKLKDVCSSAPDFCSCIQPLLGKVLEESKKNAAGPIKNAICQSQNPPPFKIEGALLYTAITLLGEEWTPNEVVKLIEDGFVPAANALKGKWSDIQVVKLIKDGFVPAASALKENWSADDVATLIRDDFVLAANALKGKWGDTQVVKLIKDGFATTILEMSDAGWSLQNIRLLLFGDSKNFISLIQAQNFKLSSQATLIFVRDVLAPAAIVLRKQDKTPQDIKSVLLQEQWPKENDLCLYVEALFKQWCPKVNATNALSLSQALCKKRDNQPTQGALTHLGIYLIAAGWEAKDLQSIIAKLKDALDVAEQCLKLQTGSPTKKKVALNDFYRALREDIGKLKDDKRNDGATQTSSPIEEQAKLLGDLLTGERHHHGMLGFYILKYVQKNESISLSAPKRAPNNQQWFWETYWEALPQGSQELARLLIGAALKKRAQKGTIHVFEKGTRSDNDAPFHINYFRAFILGARPERDAIYWLASLLSLKASDSNDQKGQNSGDQAAKKQEEQNLLKEQAKNIIEALQNSNQVNFKQAKDITPLLNILLKITERPNSAPPQSTKMTQIQAVQIQAKKICDYLQKVVGQQLRDNETALKNLQYAALYYYFDGLLEAGEMEKLPVPVLYFPPNDENSKGLQAMPFKDFISSTNNGQSSKDDDSPENDRESRYRESILWGQFNAVMWIEKRNYPLAGAKGNAQFSDPASYLYLLREVIDRKLWQQLAPAVKEHAAQKEKAQWKAAASLYTLLERMRTEQDRIAAVGLEQIGRFYPFITLDVALATTPLPEEGSGWKVERHYLGEGNWGLVGKVRHYFYSEVGPATHLMLLVGPYGTGKTSVAQVLTHSLVEITPPDWYILAPKGEEEALEFLPVNRYNVFYLFRQAELSRVELKERLAQLRYYIPPHKNIIVNFAELNAAQPEEIRERLGYLESILRELREKAIPKRVLIFMALNYAGLFKEFLDFLAVRPDLVMGGARLSHIWVLRSGRMALHLPEDRKFWKDRKLLPAQKQKSPEQDALINISSIIEEWYNDDQLAGWTREELFLETYLTHRVFGRASLYRHNDLPAQEVMIQQMVRALLNRPSYNKKGTQAEKIAGSSFRTLLWLIKARLFQEALRQANREVPPVFEEIIHRAPGEEKLVSSRQGIEEQFLESWGLVRPRLAEYIGTDALMRLAMRQGFVRNLNAYLMRELELRHAERLAAHHLTDTSGSPVAKYREVLAISALLEGLMSATSYRFGLENIAHRVKIENIQESDDDEAKGRLKIFTFKCETLGKKEKDESDTITARLVQPKEQDGKKTQWKVEGDVATFFSGQDSAPFDGAFVFTKEEKKKEENEEKNQRESIRILLLVDVVHGSSSDNKKKQKHHKDKMAIFGSKDGESSNGGEGDKDGESGKWQVYQANKDIDFWNFGRALRETVNAAASAAAVLKESNEENNGKGENNGETANAATSAATQKSNEENKEKNILIAVDIAYEDRKLQDLNDPTQRTFRITSFAIGAATPDGIIQNIVDKEKGGADELPVKLLTDLGFVKASKEKD